VVPPVVYPIPSRTIAGIKALCRSRRSGWGPATEHAMNLLALAVTAADHASREDPEVFYFG
jgi:hypothetical protein